MKVKELIEKLKTFPEDMEVLKDDEWKHSLDTPLVYRTYYASSKGSGRTNRQLYVIDKNDWDEGEYPESDRLEGECIFIL